MGTTAAWTWSLLTPVLLVSAVWDLRSRRIPDVVTLPAIALLLAVRGGLEGVGGVESGLVSGLIGAAGAGGFFALWARGGRMGWGDVKLMTAVGAAFGFPAVQGAALFVALVGALQALVLLLWQGAVWQTLERVMRPAGAARPEGAGSGGEAGRTIPFGVAIALGSFWTMWWDRAALAAH